MDEGKIDFNHLWSVASPEPHHWRSGSDEPEKPSISSDSLWKWRNIEPKWNSIDEKWVEP